MNQTDANFAKVESAVEIMMATDFFNSASFATYLPLNNMRTMQEMLFDSLTDVYKGHMDVHLLSPVELMKQLNMISGRLPKSLSLPVNNPREDIKDIYKLLYVKARVTSNYFLFEVHVPLISDDEFLLYRAIPLPMKTETETTTVLVQSPYIAVNFQKDNYISITENDIKMCIQLKERRYICHKNLPVFNLHNKNAPCEALLLSHGVKPPCDVKKTTCVDAWIALHSPNSWLVICCGVCTLRTICDTDVMSRTMTMSSIITIAQGCIL
ncbi:unnamed protein product [Parnassius mnemosyne]|uniref:Uncharacterized protein n=1 Tax=Parnassius mnemosyne TaxID=213953 RepID=A0AAV1M3B1_9NEOP